MALQPYEQGHLDNYCGLYSIANAMKLMDTKIRGEEAIALFGKIIRSLERRRRLRFVATRGMLPGELKTTLKEVITKGYGIAVTRPYMRRKPRVNRLFNEIMTYLEEEKGRVVIIAIDGGWDEMSHWSVIKGITGKAIHLFDSTCMKKLYREKFTTSYPTATRPYSIDPKDVFFLRLERRERGNHVSAKNK